MLVSTTQLNDTNTQRQKTRVLKAYRKTSPRYQKFLNVGRQFESMKTELSPDVCLFGDLLEL